MTGWNCLQLLSTYTVRMLSLADGFFYWKMKKLNTTVEFAKFRRIMEYILTL